MKVKPKVDNVVKGQCWPSKHVAIHSTLVETNKKKKVFILLKIELYKHLNSFFLHIKDSIFWARGYRSVGPLPWNGQGPEINL